MTISVVVAAYRSRETIAACLDSIITQDHPSVELIVIDGASGDGTTALLEERDHDITIRISEPDRGVYDAWNKALDHATGEWITFVGSDDVYAAPDVLTLMAPHLSAARDRERVVFGGVEVVDERGVVVRALGAPWSDMRAEFREHMTLPHPATFHHRSLFEEHGRFDDTFRIVGDYEFLLRELLMHDALFVPDLTVVRMGAGGLSDHPASAARVIREKHRARYMHGLVSEPEWRSPAVYRAVIHARINQLLGRRVADRVGDAYRLLSRSGRREPPGA